MMGRLTSDRDQVFYEYLPLVSNRTLAPFEIPPQQAIANV